MYLILGLIIGALIGYSIGWSFAHKTVATECERLGSFYVGAKTYHCTKVEDRTLDLSDFHPRVKQ